MCFGFVLLLVHTANNILSRAEEIVQYSSLGSFVEQAIVNVIEGESDSWTTSAMC